MFDIIIPVYNQKEEMLQECLSSLLRQRIAIDKIHVTIINDGGESINIDTDKYPFDIQYLEYETNRGPGYARQYGIDHTIHEFIVFLDSDDVMGDQYLSFLANAESIEHQDVYYPPKLELYDQKAQTVTRTVDNAFPDNIYSLAVSRQFIEEQGIRFLSNYFHEDGFYTLALAAHGAMANAVSSTVCRHRCNNDESMAAFHNTIIYDLSLAFSVAEIYKNFLSATESYYVNNESNLYIDCIYSRLTSITPMQKDSPAEFLMAAFAACLWPTLPDQVQTDIRSLVNDFAIESLELNQQVLKDVNTALTEICAEDSDKDIFTFLLNEFNWAYNFNHSLKELDLPPCTIVIPTYNNVDSDFDTMLGSIRQQFAAPWLNVLIVDDGSDGPVTKEYCQKFLGTEIPLTVIRSPSNRGVGVARQLGLQNVMTPYMMFADMDDGLANSTILWKFLIIMSSHPEYFGIRGYEVWQKSETECSIIAEEFYDCNMLHGLFCSMDEIKKYHMRILPLQYGEDGLFILECKLHDLKVLTLSERFYIRRSGHLTNGVEAILSNFNSITDTILSIRYLAWLEIEDKETANRRDALLHNLLQTLMQQLGLLDDSHDSILLKEQVGEMQELYQYYFLYEALKLLPIEAVHMFRASQIIQNTSMQFREVSSVLCLNENDVMIGGHRFAWNELCNLCKNWFLNDLQQLRQINPNSYMPVQALRHLPWCYDYDKKI